MPPAVIASSANDPSAGEYTQPETAKGQLDYRLTLFSTPDSNGGELDFLAGPG